MKIQFLEIYNDQISDLLATFDPENNPKNQNSSPIKGPIRTG